jgi:hypothetical protein
MESLCLRILRISQRSQLGITPLILEIIIATCSARGGA